MEDKIDFLVRYSETDQMSFVYHGNYVKYFEMGRIAWLKKLGISYRQMEDDGILLPVIDVKINFRKSALFDDKLTLTTKLKRTPSYMIEFEVLPFSLPTQETCPLADYQKMILFP